MKRPLALWMCLTLAMCMGCAVDHFGPGHPWIYAYSRNKTVCYPTAIGNLIGMVPGAPLFGLGMIVASPFSLIDRDLQIPEAVGGVLFFAPVLLGGAMTGTLFLPFANQQPEDRCGIH